jgi:ribose transport system permease protein
MSKRVTSLGPPLFLLVLVFMFSALTENFASFANLAAILEAAAIPAIVAVGLTFILMQASIDLSVEGITSFANVLLAVLVANSVTATDIGLWAIPFVIGMGLLIGATSAMISIYVRMPSLIVTLGMWLTTVGLAALIFPDRLPQILDSRITSIAISKVWGLSFIVYLTFVVIIIATIVERHTRFGRMSRAIGENEPVLIMSGIRVIRHKIAAFAIAGGCYALAGILLGARIGVGNPQSGIGLLFPAIAACVLGGTLLSGGHGGIRQSMIGVLILITLRNGLIQLGADPLLQSAMEGAVIIVAVAGSTWHLRRKIRVIK